MIFRAIINQNLSDLRQYEKIHMALYRFVSDFFKKNLELVFLKFERSQISFVVEKILIPGI